MAVMGIAQNSINFGGISSAAYDLYIGGEGVWNAPTRAVEVVEIPGRNGSIAIDQGHWENITVVYTIINNEASLADFRTKIDAFRNAICSQNGYQRLADSFHPDEYRLAMFVDGMEVKPINYTAAAEFEIKFNCKPQRFLTSGESEISITSGDELYNPTPYEAGPLIEAVGYGTIAVGDYEIEIANATMGEVVAGYGKRASDVLIPLDGSLYNTGDAITVNVSCSVSLSQANSYLFTGATGAVSLFTSKTAFVSGSEQTVTFTAGADDVESFSITGTLTGNNGTSRTDNISFTLYVTYISGDETISVSVVDNTTPVMYSVNEKEVTASNVTADSSVSTLGNPTYVDCDLGECYKIVSGSVVDLNAYIDLGSDLPVLKPGINEITFDNTITSLKIVPRWWQL